MSLQQRQERFQKFASRFRCDMVCPLLATHSIRRDLFERLQMTAAQYLARSLADQSVVSSSLMADPERLLLEFESQLPRIKNVTPNGMIVPKRDHVLEYNIFASAFMDIMHSLSIDDLIDTWVNPPNVRFKEGQISQEKLQRNFASEYPHSEAWIPLNGKECLSVFIPIFGDLERNYVEFFAPPTDFTENWLDPKPSYRDAGEIVARYRPLPAKYLSGNLYLADAATVHATRRLSGAGPRLSIDVNFMPLSEIRRSEAHEIRHESLRGIGREKLLVFHDSLDQTVETSGTPLHPTQHRTLLHL